LPNILNWTVQVDRTQADLAINDLDNKTETTKSKIERLRPRLMQYWSLATQISNMMLAQAQRAAKASEKISFAQVASTGIMLVQSELMVGQTLLSAKAAAIKQNYAQAAMFYAIAGLMQKNVFEIQLLKIAARRNQNMTRDIERQIAAYR